MVRVTVTKPVSFRVGRLRELLKTKYVAQSCPEPPFILREPQDERRVEGDDTGIVAVTVRRDNYFLIMLEELLEPFHGEFHGPPAVVGLREPVVSALDDMNFFGAVQSLKDLPGLVHRDEFVLLPVNHHAV